MQANIIQIGNSKGIILPASIIRKLGLSLKSSVEIESDGDTILIKPTPRQGWAEAAKQMAQAGDDEIMIPDLMKEEDLSWWTWNEEER
ncbi:MAG: AbrB/MazE/SpoVT family DNA-binding domain-containing protein [Bacteroidia bacterium]|nr:AbrB/MazE/SpoVT family DNA-binding domain-containing protein [Bacteroidia bacterium]